MLRSKQKNQDNSPYPNFRRAQDILQDADCEVVCSRGVKLHCHVTILSQWSSVIADHYQSRDTSKKAVIDLQDFEEQDLTEMLMIIYPPNKPVTEWNIWKVLPLASELHMKALLKKCEDFLTTKGASIKLLTAAQKYNLDELMSKQLSKFKHISIRKIENDPGFLDIDPNVMNKLLTNRIEILENRHQVNIQKKNERSEQIDGLYTIFGDVKKTWAYQGTNAKSYRRDNLLQIERELDCLLGNNSSTTKLSRNEGQSIQGEHGTPFNNNEKTPENSGTPRDSNTTNQNLPTSQPDDERMSSRTVTPRYSSATNQMTPAPQPDDNGKHTPAAQTDNVKKRESAPQEGTFMDLDLLE